MSKASSSKGMWTAVPDDEAVLFREALASLAGTETKKMFGCPCAFVQGQMYAVFHPTGLALKLSDEDRSALLDLPEAVPFEPMPGRAMRQYAVLPPDLASFPDELLAWLGKAHAYARTLPPKEGKR